ALAAAMPLAQQPLPESELRDTVARYSTDRQALFRRYEVGYSPAQRDRLRAFYREWQDRVAAIDFDRLGVEGRIDRILFDTRLRRELAQLDLEEARYREMQRFLPFAPAIEGLVEARRRMETVRPSETARVLASLAAQADSLRTALEKGTPDTARATRIVALRSVGFLESLRRNLQRWYGFYAGYDPVFTWWNKDPGTRADSAMARYARALRTRVIGQREGEDEPIIGDPIGGDALRAELAFELIPYGPEELVEIAEKEFAWSEAEMKRASRELGFGDDWKRALEQVKNSYVEPGRQPDLVRDLALEAIEYIENRDLVTVPPLAREIWRMEMLSPEQQKVSPFFLGGERILVSYPTDGMPEDEKLMSLRGNNPHFSRATVFHELIPGHHLQGFMTDRYNAHREAFSTPFWTEGWALYWEMLLWDRGFQEKPADRVGALFWRMHRSARIIFSLRFHLGTMTPQEAIDFLVDRVGHERANATAEVRRSFNGSYPPLYQIAYMIGGLQFRALHRDLVASGRMTDKAFHDAVLHGGNMPVEMVRARLTGARLPADYRPAWRFYR
ncbi:MAG TPA: DUF885 family protein, partial [Gemmatimonadales bacterium]|nr:DUF885 family protein [Gemmatimonadales bacterium]